MREARHKGHDHAYGGYGVLLWKPQLCGVLVAQTGSDLKEQRFVEQGRNKQMNFLRFC